MPTEMSNANFPTDADGRTYHVYLRPGEAAQRVLTVGDLPRALQFARLPGFEPRFVRRAPRLFTSITGLYRGVPVTIVTALMGTPNMDFTVRELRHVVRGEMAVVRVGTCGSPADVRVGDVTVPGAYRVCQRDPDGFGPGARGPRYRLSAPFRGDDDLAALLRAQVRARCAGSRVVDGTNVTTCSFYSSQGRQDPNFRDHNETLVDDWVREVPDLVSIEMESGHLVDLARCCNAPIHAAAAHIVVAQRRSQDFITNERKHEVETALGIAALEALVAFGIRMETPPGAVWTGRPDPRVAAQLQELARLE